MVEKQVGNEAPVLDATVPEEAKPKSKAKLPAGLTQEMVDTFKAAWPKVGLARVAGVSVVIRPLLREEYAALREASKSEDGLNEAMAQKAMLWHEEKDAVQSAGFRQGLLATIADMSDVRDAALFLVDDDMAVRWPEIMKGYPAEKRFDVAPYREKYQILWAMVTDDQVYLVTFVTKSDYDQVANNNPEALEDRMIQHGLIYPRLVGADLKRLTYGRYQSLLSNIMITTGFNPEPAVIL